MTLSGEESVNPIRIDFRFIVKFQLGRVSNAPQIMRYTSALLA